MSGSVQERVKTLSVAIVLAMALSGCGGGGGGAPVQRPGVVRLPAGHGLAAGAITVAPGASEERGNVVVTCPAGGGACVVTVMADGTAAYDREGGVPSVMPRYDAWGPLGHGLTAGEIRVPAGVTRDLGNMVVTCPAGGSACVVRVAADGAAEYAATGGVPTFTFVHPTHERDNPTAEDLLDHWNDPGEQLRRGLGLARVNPGDEADRTRRLTDLINMAGGDPAGSGTRLRNFRQVRPEDIEIIGERGGITYGRWTGGPAGTLNIEFDWRFAPDFDAATRARNGARRKILVLAVAGRLRHERRQTRKGDRRHRHRAIGGSRRRRAGGRRAHLRFRPGRLPVIRCQPPGPYHVCRRRLPALAGLRAAVATTHRFDLRDCA